MSILGSDFLDPYFITPPDVALVEMEVNIALFSLKLIASANEIDLNFFAFLPF